MGDFALVDEQTGHVSQIVTFGNKADVEEAGYLKGTNLQVIDLPTNYNAAQIKNTSYYDQDDKEFKTRGEKPIGFYHWTLNKKWEIDRTTLMLRVRAERDNLLYQSDWTQLADSPLSDSKKAEWVTYRQALRDIPAGVSEEEDGLEGLNWPTKPS